MEAKLEKVTNASYEAPMIEIIDIKLDQNILDVGSSPDTPDTPGEVW